MNDNFMDCEECGQEWAVWEMKSVELPRYVLAYPEYSEDDGEPASEFGWVTRMVCPECVLLALRSASDVMKYWSQHSREKMIEHGMPQKDGRHHYWTGASKITHLMVRDAALRERVRNGS